MRRPGAGLLSLVLALCAVAAGCVPSATPPRRARAEVTLLALVAEDRVREAESLVGRMGGAVVGSSPSGLLVVRLPEAAARRFARAGLVQAVDRDVRVGINSVRVSGEPGHFTAQDAAALARANLAAIGVAEWQARMAADGSGVTVAVVDTGIDVSHPDLGLTAGGQVKVTHWVDFTGEGDVDTRAAAEARGGTIATPWGEYRVEGAVSRSNTFHFGMLWERQLDPHGTVGQDLDRNGSRDDGFGVLVVDSAEPGRYDAVYVDTDRDRDFGNERRLRPYDEFFDIGWLGVDDPQTREVDRVSFVVTTVRPDGKLANLGFDGNGHGTHVAASLAAFSGLAGSFPGTAPGAQLMSLKALGSGGDGSWSAIARAIAYAADNGADIVCISVGLVPGSVGEETVHPGLMNRLSREKGVVFVLAAGNDGPGLGTCAAPSGAEDAIVVGAHFFPEMFSLAYGTRVAREGVWYFSAAGPGADGGVLPTGVAPGAAAAPVPLWAGRTGYMLCEGTSMAASYAAGAAALLLSAARETGLSPSPARLKRALEMGARKIEGYDFPEQGHGVLHVLASWEHLVRLGEIPAIDADCAGPVGVEGARGVYARDFLPGFLACTLTNLSRLSLNLSTGAGSWFRPDRSALILPPGGQRVLGLGYTVPREPGLHAHLAVLDDPSMYGHEAYLPSAVVVPHLFEERAGWSFSVRGRLAGAFYARHFFKVPEGAGEMVVSLFATAGEGMVRMHLYDPAGKPAHTSGFASRTEAQVSYAVPRPAAGVWEAVAYCPPGEAVEYVLGGSLREVVCSPGAWKVSVPAGAARGVAVAEFEFFNLGEGLEAKVEAMGLAPYGSAAEPERVSIADGQTIRLPPVVVAPDVVLLRFAISNPVDPAADIDLYLYRFNAEAKIWEEVASSVTPGGSEEMVEVLSPEEGEYLVAVEAYHVPQGATAVELRRWVMRGTGAITTDHVDGPRPAGSRWKMRATLVIPESPGEYVGHILLRDATTGQRRLRVPVVVETGAEGLSVRLFPRVLELGSAGLVTLEAMSAATGEKVDVVAEVDGRMFQAREGRVSFPVQAPGEAGTFSVAVRIEDRHYCDFAGTFTLLAAQADRPREFVSNVGPGDAYLRRKALNLMR